MSETKKSKSKKRDHGSGSISQRKDGTWTARIQIGTTADGKQKIKAFYGKTSSEVKKKLKEYKKQSSQFNMNNIKKNSVEEYITDWLKKYKINEIKETSYDRLESTINNHIIPNLGYIQLSQLNADDIQNLLNKLVASNLSYSSIKKVYNALNSCLNHAVIRDHIIKNPCLAVNLPAQSKFNKRIVQIYTEDEIQKIKTECVRKYSTGTPIYQHGEIIILILNTGMRMGEVLGLKWEDIDFENKTIHVCRNVAYIKNRNSNLDTTKGYRVEVKEFTKTDAGNRLIPMNNTSFSLINSLKSKSSDENSYVFENKNGNVISPHNLEKKFNKILKNCNIEKTGLHTLRHTFASMLFKKGVDVKTVSEILGHADVRITYNTYIHLIKEQKHDAVNLLDDL